LIVPPCLADPLELPLDVPPPDGLSSLLPHAATPSASTAAAEAASHLFDLTGEHSSSASLPG
jgi:hypothetical protein